MTATVKILSGLWRGNDVINAAFEVVQDFTVNTKTGKNFITVLPNERYGHGLNKLRINVSRDSFEYITRDETVANKELKVPSKKVLETDEAIIERIHGRFEALSLMTRATIEGHVRAMIVVGPPGVGKSYGIEQELTKNNLFNAISGARPNYEVVKGAMTPIGLYSTLYQNSSANTVLVFDDCDSIFQDDLSLNLLKAALDTSKKRKISWHSDSSYLRKEQIPDSFEFKGSVIFITNMKFTNVKSKKMQDHLEALESRCHFVDLTLDTMRDKYLRIKHIHKLGSLFKSYNFERETEDEIINFIGDNQHKVREMSLRTALKVADLVKVSNTTWKELANITIFKSL